MMNRSGLAIALLVLLTGCSDSTSSSNSPDAGSDLGDAGANNLMDMGTDQPESDAGSDLDVTEPSLELSLDTSNVRTRIDSTTQLAFTVERMGGLSGTISVAANGLPAGVAAEAVTVNVASNQASLVLNATSSAAQGGPFTVTVRAVSDEDAEIFAESDVQLFVAGAPGTPDSSFSSDGSVAYSFSARSETLNSVLPAADATLLVAGARQSAADPLDAFTFRLQPNGDLDASYGTNGVYDAYDDVENVARSLYEIGDQTYLINSRGDGTNNRVNYFSRLTDTGATDPNWANGGYQVSPSIVTVLPNDGGFILVNRDGLERLDENGSPDTAFEAYQFADDEIIAATIDSQDRILLALANSVVAPRVARLTPAGDIDTTFGSGGISTIETPSAVEAGLSKTPQSIVVDSSDNVFTLVNYDTSNVGAQWIVSVAKLSEDGTRDSSFGSAGHAIVTSAGYGVDIHVFGDKLFINYQVYVSINRSNPFLTAYNSDGSLDTSFNTTGRLAVPGSGRTALDPWAGRLIWFNADVNEMTFIRYWL